MNFNEFDSHDSGESFSYVSVVRNALGAALLGCLMSCTAPMKILSDSANLPRVPYQNVNNLGKELPPPPVGSKSSRKIDALARFLFPDNSPKGSDTFVDDDGNNLSQDELEARDE